MWTTPTLHLLANGLFIAKRAWLVKHLALQVARQILLGYPVVAVGMGIEIPASVPKTLGIAARVLEVRRHLALALLLDHLQRVKEGKDGIGLGRCGQIQSRLGQRETPLG